MEGKGLGVDMGKTRVLMSGPGLDVLQKSGKDPCGVCLKSVGANSIFFGGCSSWIPEKCNGIPGRLKFYVNFRCKRCTGQARPTNGRPMTQVTVDRKKLRWWHPSVTLGTAYPQVAVVNSLLSQDAVLHWANSTSSCPSSIQVKPGPQVYLTCIACNVTTEL